MRYSKEMLEPIVNKSNSISEILRNLGLKQCGGSHTHITKIIKKYEISTSHFNKKISYLVRRHKFTKEEFIEKVLVLNGSNWQSHSIKLKLFEFNLKERKCEKCGQLETWFNEKLSLQLHHVNSNRTDNGIVNLMILCPNCHSQTTSFSKNKMRKSKKNKSLVIKDKLPNYCECGSVIKNRSKLCLDCYAKSMRKVIRPEYVELTNSIKLIGYAATGRKYGVSDNAIRKWSKINTSIV